MVWSSFGVVLSCYDMLYLCYSGVPASKIMLGLALYGHHWYTPDLGKQQWAKYGVPATIQGKCCGPFKPTYGGEPGPGSGQCGMPHFSSRVFGGIVFLGGLSEGCEDHAVGSCLFLVFGARVGGCHLSLHSICRKAPTGAVLFYLNLAC